MDDYIKLFKERMDQLKQRAEINPCGRSGGWLGLESEREILYKKIEDCMNKMAEAKECGPFDQFLYDADMTVIRQAQKKHALDTMASVFDYADDLNSYYNVPVGFLDEQITKMFCEISNEKVKAQITQVMIQKIMNVK